MSITYVGSGANAGATVTIPTHQSGDLILIFAYRDGSNTAPTTPTAGGTVPTWTLIGSDGANTNSTNFRYAVATASTTTSGTWTNATEIICLVYRGTRLVGTSAGSGANNSTSIAYPALTLQRTDGSSWVVGVAGHRTATNVEVAPTGMTNRASTGTEAAGHDTNGAVSSWSQQTVTVNASSAWRSWTVELRDNSLSVIGAAGSFNETGQAAGLVYGRKLISAVGSLNEAGQAATLKAGRKLIGAAGALTEAGQDALLKSGRVVPAAAGTCALTGQAATLTKGAALNNYTLAGGAGSYALSGQAAGVTGTRLLGGGVGAFTASGQSAGFQGQKYLPGGAGAVAATGQPAGLRVGRVAAAAAGGYVLSGQDAALSKGGGVQSYTLSGAGGAFVLVGQAAGLVSGRKVAGAAAAFALSGQAATLTFANLQSYTLLGTAGVFAATGKTANLRRGFAPLNAGAGAVIITGQAASYGYGRKLGSAVGPFTLTGQQATPKAARLLVSAAAGYAASGQASTLTKAERRRVVIFM